NMTVLNNAYPTIPKMQTEYSEKDWLTLSQIIHNSLVVENVSAYLVWDLIWPGGDFMDMEIPWNSGSWVNPNGFKVGTKYYAFKQYAYFIKPGYSRIETTGGTSSIKVSAFLSPDSLNMSIIAINTSATNDSIAISPASYTISSGNIFRTTATENCSSVGAYSGGNIKLPPKSITTFALKGAPVTVGITTIDNEDNNYLLAFPNPFSDKITLNLQNFSNKAVIEIYTVSGQILYREKVENIPSGKIGSDLPKGIYFLGITDGAKRFTNKIIKI
ncbi:MAG TPA: T9SS type A sorting domain-containing protein, partial [Prolixibacteraceae bacterium]|nr:T9SS type A sorting domain-containing protein [Prolixibacteraceae bacterium]